MNKSLLVVFLIIHVACGSRNDEETIRPSIRSITESVYASATVVPQNTYNSRPYRSGIIKEVYVKEGDQVVKNQRIFKINPTAVENNRLRNAEINLQEAKENYLGQNSLLRNIEIEIATLKDQIRIDSINYKRTERLWQQNIGRENDLDNALLKYQSSKNKLSTLETRYFQTKTNLKNQYEKARNLSHTETLQLKDFEIKSEISGQVFSIYKEIGEYISPQENFAEIGSSKEFKIELNIDEVDISKIETSDTAVLRLEAYPNDLYTSIITYISGKKDESTQTFEVECEFVETPPKLYYGLSGEANILIARRNNTLIIPSEYLINGNKVKTSEGLKEVILGIKDLESVEILSGIDSLTTLVKPY